MSGISRANLFGKLNPLAYRAIEGATVFCKLRGNPYVELAHWLNQILQTSDSDMHRIVKHYNLDASRLARDIPEALEMLPRGATAVSDFSPHIEDIIERGWVYGTLMFGETAVRTGHLIVGAMKTSPLKNALNGMSREFAKIKGEDLSENFAEIVKGSPEAHMVTYDGSTLATPAASGDAAGAIAPALLGRQEALKKYAIDLTAKARNGEIDPVLGRDMEMRQIVDILMRRRQNNPILTGEAGVGKTAVVEGFALRIASGDVPPQLKDVKLYSLDIGLLQAGASMKGEFENRLRQVIDEVQSSVTPVILFIDEAHTLIGAGGAVGTGDAANLLKPALARGKLRTIAATTWEEYKKYFEKDPALTRRFQVVQVHEPSEEKTILMLRAVASALESHHRVQLLDEAIEAAVKLSHRFIQARQLPDKAVSLIDTACARVAVSQHATPPVVEDMRRQIDALTAELGIAEREASLGIDPKCCRESIKSRLAAANERLTALENRWELERELVKGILDIRTRLRSNAAADDKAESGALADVREPVSVAREPLLAELKRLQAILCETQGDSPLIFPTVDAQIVASVVQDWTGIPVGRMVKNEVDSVLNLVNTLNNRIIGQRHGLETITRRIQTSRAKLDNPNKPIGVFMLCGPSGVGKTETALALAESLYGGEQNVITINMNEFQEAHAVSTLKGSPPGYVGYGEGGILTEAVRRRPYSVVLLDEVEKAHPDVYEMFFQVFDKGWMEDGEGRYIDFKNTVIILTSNVGSDLIMNMCRDHEFVPEPEMISQSLREPLLAVFPAALLGRVVVIPYLPLSDDMLGNIIRLQLDRIKRRVQENHGVPFEYKQDVVELITTRCTELESGGRMIDGILTNTVLPRISQEFLTRIMKEEPIKRVELSVAGGDFQYAFD